MEYDFSGYVTRYGVKCSDGRIIRHGAFQDCDGITLPLVWHHMHDDPNNVLGKVLLECRNDGVYGYGAFNDTPQGKNAKMSVAHGDITAMSIYANNLSQQGSDVMHGKLREVSLVLAGANPGAYIDNLRIQHGDMIEDLNDEAIIYTGENFMMHGDDYIAHEGEKTLQDIVNSMSEEQKNALYAIVGMAVGGDNDDEMEQDDMEDGMDYNIFDQSATQDSGPVLSHDAINQIFQDAISCGSLRDSVMAHADDYGITNIDMLFPEARQINGDKPEWIKRKTDWVAGVLNGCHHSPFSRIKMVYADITADEARAKGYIKGNLKKEEFFGLAKRSITPTTIYKKQKLDRDDIVDVTDFDVVAWIKAEMRLMLEEEIARAILIGDGREVDDEDKINENCLIPIAKEHELYATHLVIPANATPEEQVEILIRALEYFEGTGTPDLYTYKKRLIDWQLMKDKNGRYIYDNLGQIASKIGVGKIVDVDVMKGHKLSNGNELLGIIVNLSDYTIGADKGGKTEFFDDFDIDYNQYKYLYETRISGCLTKLKSAIIVEIGSASAETGVGPGLSPTDTLPSLSNGHFWNPNKTSSVEPEGPSTSTGGVG